MVELGLNSDYIIYLLCGANKLFNFFKFFVFFYFSNGILILLWGLIILRVEFSVVFDKSKCSMGGSCYSNGFDSVYVIRKSVVLDNSRFY